MRISILLSNAILAASLVAGNLNAGAETSPPKQTKQLLTAKEKAAQNRYRKSFAQGITRTDQLPSMQLQSIRKRMISQRSVSYRELQTLADKGDGLAALFVGKRLSGNPDLTADAIHYYTIACSTGRAGAVGPLVSLLARGPTDISQARLSYAETTLRDHATRGNPVAMAALIRFYKSGHPFGMNSEVAQKLQRQAAKGGDGKMALDLAIAMISEGLPDENNKTEALNYLHIAEKSNDLKVKTIAAAVVRTLERTPVTAAFQVDD
jgi:TPR repeat protein